MQAYSEFIIVKLKRLQFDNTLTNLIHLYKHLIKNIKNIDSRVGGKIILLKRNSRNIYLMASDKCSFHWINANGF